NLFALVTPRHNEHIRALVVPRLVTTRRLTPRRHRVTSARGLTLTTAVRMVDRVHRHTTVGWANTLPAVASGLSDRHILVIGIANLANRRHALHEHAPRLAGGQLQQSVVALLRHQLHLR